MSVSHLKIYMEPTFPLHLFLMLHSRGQSKRLCSSPFKTYRVDHLTPLCGPPLEEHRSMNSPLKDTLVWPSPPCFQQIINLQVKLTPYNLIYLAHARPKHVVHATSNIVFLDNFNTGCKYWYWNERSDWYWNESGLVPTIQFLIACRN